MAQGFYRGAHPQMANQIASLPSASPEIGKQVINEVLPQQRAPVKYGMPSTQYRPSTGTVEMAEADRLKWPINAYVHEQMHAMQTPQSAAAPDAMLRGGADSDRAAREMAPVFAGNIAEYEARRRAGASPLTKGVELAPGYDPSLEWMRQQASQYGMFQGKPMETMIAENPQFSKMMIDKYADEPQVFYEEGSLTPLTKEQYSVNKIKYAIEQAKKFLNRK